MNTRRTRSLLWLMTAGLVATAGGVVGMHFAMPARLGSAASHDTPAANIPGEHDDPQALTGVDQASLRLVASKDIRQRLFDPPVVVAKPPPAKPMPPVELVSTILRAEGKHSAWVREGQAMRKLAVGDTIGPEDNPAKLTAIEAGQIILEHAGKRVEVVQTTGGRR